MPWFLTDYRANWRAQDDDEAVAGVGAYGGHLWARNAREAKRIAQRRGLGERVINNPIKEGPPPYKQASTLASSKANPKEVVHALCYLGMIAVASGKATAQEVIGDEGVIHAFCHQQNAASKQNLIEKIKEIERRTPGYSCPLSSPKNGAPNAERKPKKRQRHPGGRVRKSAAG